MSVNIYDSTTDTLHKVAGLVDDTDLKQDIEDIQAVIPSTASASNQLVTASDNTNAPITVLKPSSSNVVDFDDLVPDNLTISSRKIFMVISDSTNVVNSPRSTRNMIVICYNTVGNVTRQNQIAISEDGTKQMWQRNCTGGTWSTWTEFLTGDMLTSSVTSGSTAPITSGGVYDVIPKRKEYAYQGATTANTEIVLDASTSHDWWKLMDRVLSISLVCCDNNDGIDANATVYTKTSTHSLYLRPTKTTSSSYYRVIVCYTGTEI